MDIKPHRTVKLRLATLRWLAHPITVISAWACAVPLALASVYSGEGIEAGVEQARSTGVGSGDLRVTIASIVNEVLTYVSLFAVAVIIIAGLYLILGIGSDSSKDTAKKIIIYVAVGLLVILLSRTFVELIKTLVT